MIALLSLVLLSQRAAAEVTIYLAPSGNNVVATITGSANVTALAAPLHSSGFTVFIPYEAFLVAGGTAGSEVQMNLDRYDLPLTGPSSIGTSSVFAPGDINTGSIAGILYSPTNGSLYLPRNYVSGSALSGTTTWTNVSFSYFGLTEGQSFTWTWGSGANTDSLTVLTVSEPSSVALIGAGLIGLVVMRRRKRRPTV